MIEIKKTTRWAANSLARFMREMGENGRIEFIADRDCHGDIYFQLNWFSCDGEALSEVSDTVQKCLDFAVEAELRNEEKHERDYALVKSMQEN